MDVTSLGNIFNQNISFDGFDSKYSARILTQDVTVNCSVGTHHHGSSNVKLTNVVDYNWELRYSNGQMLAVHIDGNVIAYGMKGKNGSMIRVANQKNNNRTLIKDIGAPILDLSFAIIPKQIILGCADTEGSIYIYEIDDQSDSVVWSLVLHVIHPKPMYSTANNYRIIWCPYLPSYEEESDGDVIDDPAKLFVFLNGSKAEIFDVSIVNSQYGSDPLCPTSDIEGFIEISEHILDIVDASFSPDGTALATSSLDGYVKFFQVDMPDNEKPRFLHEWKPHDGKALSCLFFLDNILHNYTTDFRFWKFAVTGSNHNTELKIWSCESWTCLQTIRFLPNPTSIAQQLFMKARLDMTGQYLVLSDINNRTLYILKLQRKDSEQVALVSSISRFLLPAPFLSFCIVSADEKKQLRSASSNEDLYTNDVDDFEDATLEAVVEMNMFVVQPKQLQECLITFQPENFYLNDEKQNGLENLEKEKNNDPKEEKNELLKLDDLQPSVNLLIQQNNSQQQSLNLMTPEAFSSPTQTISPTKPNLSKAMEQQIDNEDVRNDLINLCNNDQQDEKPQKDNFASGGSSPSREVQEIFSFKNDQEFFDELMNVGKEAKMANTNTTSHYGNQTGEIEENSFSENLNRKQTAVWSSIPILKATEVLKEENRRQEMQQIQQQHQQQVAEETAEGTIVQDNNEFKDKSAYVHLNYRMKSLENLLQEQNEQIQRLSCEFRSFVKNYRNDSKDDIHTTFLKELDVALTRSQMQQSKMFENYFKRESDQHEKLISNVTQSLSKEIIDKLQNIVIHEINNVILPTAVNSFDNLKHQLSFEYSQKLGNMDHYLNENITKVITSKTVADSLSASILHVIQPSLEQCYRNMIERALIPSWEKVCNSMFQQIHDTFTKGTKEYTASVETYMERQRRVQDKGKDLIVQMQAVSDAMKNSAEKLTNTLTLEIQKQLSLSFSNMQDKIALTIAELVSEQVKQGLKNHVAILEDSVLNAVRSRAVTPSPHVIDTQLVQIQQALAKGQIDVAFQQALSASDLSLVVYVCEKVNPQEVFGLDKCILPQHVTLSLIQQLSADLTRNTELKYM
ncbi:enhancer of mRNA-decapping protein 4 isoform X2 [Agrilus planipennis]|uniref:Enhancer of mRNA-decapping protein 4 isoform X2 n=1 Tax=Agrilus planipennis TaxID=224129 RepID=A0A7F5RCG1_AGRPL|nr:enhancer of mRNA-decapping protein 4 isoform X2 [Agrilus planipennis]